MSCPHCAGGLPPSEAFCPECGARADDAPPPGNEGSETQTSPVAAPAPSPARAVQQAQLWQSPSLDTRSGDSLGGPALFERTTRIDIAAPEAALLPADLDAYRESLQQVFGFPDFRAGQAEVLRRLAQRDVLAVMPTGSGKSLCYVLPALQVGRAVVVSPLIALMQDQVEALQAVGVRAGFINSSLARGQQREHFSAFRRGDLDLLFVAPERFAVPGFAEDLRDAGVHLLAIDEAHCISEWGHNFRPDYLLLDSARRRLGMPRTLALTATADAVVRRDILERLGIEDAADEVVTSFDRPNLRLSVVPTANDHERLRWLVRYVREHPDQAGIVYARTRRSVEDTAAALTAAGAHAEAYHAGMAAGARAAGQRRFITGTTPIIVATNAFGMGIDKPDVRYVVHMHMPGRIEAYYQEAGRAGRDGDPAECTLLYGRRDRALQARFIAQAHPDEEQLRRIWQRLVFVARGRDDHPPTFSELDSEIGDDGLAAALAVFRSSNLIDREAIRLRSADPEAPLDRRAIEQRRRDAEARLAQMVEYAETSGCRRAVILRYFGEQADATCGRCDNCRGTAVAPSHDFPDELFTSLLEHRDRLARDSGRPPYMVFEDRTAREIATYRPADEPALLRVWGMGETRARWFGAELFAILRDWEMANPEAPPPPSPVEQARESLRGRRRSSTATPEAEVAFDDPLYQRLRAWRLERSRREEVPAYTIFNDRTARELAAAQPRDEEALRGVWGMGDARVAAFGDDLLALIEETLRADG